MKNANLPKKKEEKKKAADLCRGFHVSLHHKNVLGQELVSSASAAPDPPHHGRGRCIYLGVVYKWL